MLLIEDDDGDALLVEELLSESEEECDLDRARSIAEAESKLGDAECVIVDLGLPDAAGLEAVTAVLERVPTAAVVVLTGLADKARALAAVAAGAQDYLVKGEVSPALLGRSIRYAVERKRAAENARQLAVADVRQAESDRLARGLLPHPLVTDTSVVCGTIYQPSGVESMVGGDFYDAIELGDGTIRALVGDVCGHGPDEAALGVALRIAWRSHVLSGAAEDAVLPAVDMLLLAERATPLFTTVCDLTIDTSRAVARVRLAGHPPPILVSPEVRFLGGAVGPPLGVIEGATWPAVEHELPPAWAILLYTDGIFEGRTSTGTRLGIDGFAELVRDTVTADTDSPALCEALVRDVMALHGGPLPDDLALLLLAERNGRR